MNELQKYEAQGNEHFLIYKATGTDPLYKIWHKTEMHMIIYFYGTGGDIVCNENIFPFDRGTLCFIAAGKNHYTMPDDPQTYLRSKVFISRRYMEKLLSLLPDHQKSGTSLVYSKIPEEKITEVEQLFEEINRLSNSPYSDYVFSSNTIRLFYYLRKYKVKSTEKSSGYISKAVDFINNHIYENFSIDDICLELHISKAYLCRQFKQKTGTTIMNYVLTTRIILAQNMLKEEDISVSHVSNSCGFSSISYFSRVFKNETGLTPLAYRKKLSENHHSHKK